nr:o-methyltransferase tpca [Quercus suber]
MPRTTGTVQDIVQLLQLSKLISSSINDVIEAWATESSVASDSGVTNGHLNGTTSDGADHVPASVPVDTELPSWQLFNAQRVLLGAVGKLTELVSEPSSRLLEVSSQYNESRSLFIAAERKIPDLLAASPSGLSVAEISQKVGIEAGKLSRILRCLDTIGILREVRPEVFTNNRISGALDTSGLDLYTASDHLPTTLLDPKKGPSYDVAQTAWQNAIGTDLPRWDWLEQKVQAPQLKNMGLGYPGHPAVTEKQVNGDAQLVSRPEHEIFGLAMLGGGRVFGAAHLFGGFDLQLSKLYPQLNFVVQDRGPTIQHGKSQVWPAENPDALSEGRVTFMEHDFFQKNPIEGAEIYWLRYILHDWSDDYCIQILTGIRMSMSASSRLLIADQVMNTTLGSPELEHAPAPLPANYGYHTRYSHQRDLTMMAIINGIERTPSQFKSILNASGLEIRKIWSCRSQVTLIEATLPNA